MFTIKFHEITDGIMAVASLRGDITGRGDTLVDNDERALAEIAAALVPAALHVAGLPYHLTHSGWRIETDSVPKGYLVHLLRQKLLGAVTGSDVAPTPADAPAYIASGTGYVTPHDM